MLCCVSDAPLPAQNYFPIYSNLAEALRCARQRNNVVTIWADALCINQDDKKEKSWQLKLMVSIYTLATSVLAWIGPSVRDQQDLATVQMIKGAIETARKVWDMAQNIAGTLNLALNDHWLEVCFAVAHASSTDSGSEQQLETVAKKVARLVEKLRPTVLLNGIMQEGLAGVRALSLVENFSRVWILQETGRARILTFQYGTISIPCEPVFLALSLANYYRNSKDMPEMRGQLRGFDTRFLSCLTARTECSKGRSVTLKDVFEVVYFTSPPGHQAKDPRDQIYARLGLASDRDKIEPDYALPVGHVYANAARFLLAAGFVDPLITFKPYAHMRGDYGESLPSWAYDWSQKGLDYFIKYRACASSVPTVQFIPYSEPKAKSEIVRFKQALTLTGVSLGKIAQVGRRFHKFVSEAGLSETAVATGGMLSETGTISQGTKRKLIASIGAAHQSFGLGAQNLEKLFGNHEYPVASFWCWWTNWVLHLHQLVANVDINEELRTQSIQELLFRETSRQQTLDPTTNFAALMDLNELLEVLFEPQRSWNWMSVTPSSLTSFGIELMEYLFRAAWGMRPAVLETRRLGYFPEDTMPQDEVVIFCGVKAPLVIREISRGGAFEIIGPAHVCGAMEGQLMSVGLPERTCVLV